jgi:hypothetical protein
MRLCLLTKQPRFLNLKLESLTGGIAAAESELDVSLASPRSCSGRHFFVFIIIFSFSEMAGLSSV